MERKKWTVIMYLNGNNELGIEMENTFNNVCSVRSDDINTVIQLSKAPIEIVNLIRQDNIRYKNEWIGTRRYSVIDGEVKLQEKYSYLNMADYKNLYKFIEWSINNYPAERYMLVISGHGFIVASLSDLCGDKPYIMGLYEMCFAINRIKQDLNINIDILSLDICNMNTVELLYELGKNKNNTVKYLMTYINNGPLEGMEYKEIIPKLDNRNSEYILKDITENSINNIVISEVKHGKLEKIKSLSNKLSFYWLLINEKRATDKEIKLYNDLHQKIDKVVHQLVIAQNNKEERKSLLHLMFYNKYQIVDIDSFTKFYYKLAFTKNNYCGNVIAKKTVNDKRNIKQSDLEQEVLDFRDIELFIRNFNADNIDEKSIKVIVNKIYEFNKW
uniref:clostripain-related cysteine peptidase n=1 Tax=Clostridium sp. D53t1_180928_C8 TaxID=2787101 RepID=UPI0018AB3B58